MGRGRICVPAAVLFECRPSGVGRGGCTEEKGGRWEPKNRQREGNEHGKRKGKKKKKKRKISSSIRQLLPEYGVGRLHNWGYFV